MERALYDSRLKEFGLAKLSKDTTAIYKPIGRI